ncbi:trypsin-like peptidase domain-containing protein [Candidatus Amesbacteria bacterium]|nr:trypsin-like peptidase domain-containing protein [Candidatus Amesbacteria bacterium]
MKNKKQLSKKNFILGGILASIFLAAVAGGAVSERVWGFKILNRWIPKINNQETIINNQKIVNEENVVIDVAEKVGSSVVTIGIKKTQILKQPIFEDFDPFDDPFGQFFRIPKGQKQTEKKIDQDIGSGFIIGADGLIATNKHVVGDTEAKYQVVTSDDKKYEVTKIYRDPTNDFAILKIDATNLKPIDLGDSSKIKVGQLAIAIGTALGEFRHTVTTGVISGLGRGITAGSPFAGSVEKLDNVIQTDAAINPGNSGGPLLNSAGQVVGVNTAVSQQGQNIGFAIPINIIKDAIDNFNKTGQFSRPFMGVRYRQNEVPQGAYVEEIIEGSPAEKAGIEAGDIITKPKEIAKEVAAHKIGDVIEVEVYRDGETKKFNVTLEEAK